MKIKYYSDQIRDDIKYLSRKGLLYFGQPYTATGLNKQAIERKRGMLSEEITASALDENLQVFNPIAQSWRADSLRSDSDGTFASYEAWDNRYIDLSSCLIICGMNGWLQSKGLKAEIARFEKQGKPIYYLDVDNGIINLFQRGNIFAYFVWKLTKGFRK